MAGILRTVRRCDLRGRRVAGGQAPGRSRFSPMLQERRVVLRNATNLAAATRGLHHGGTENSEVTIFLPGRETRAWQNLTPKGVLFCRSASPDLQKQILLCALRASVVELV